MIFNRFTKSARRAVEAAVEEARELGHDCVGDEDLLLGVLCDDDGMAAQALTSLGVTLEEAREESERLFADALSSIGISFDEVRREAGGAFEMRIAQQRRLPFSPRAKKALEQALVEAVRLGDDRITAEHVLLGILREERGMAARILGNLEVGAEAIEWRLQRSRGDAEAR